MKLWHRHDLAYLFMILASFITGAACAVAFIAALRILG